MFLCLITCVSVCTQKFFECVPFKEFLGSAGVSKIDEQYIKKIFKKEISPGVKAVTPDLLAFGDYLVWATTSSERMSHIDFEV